VIVKQVLFLGQVNKSFKFNFSIQFYYLGTNACYFENLDNVPKWKGVKDDITKEVVINTEWGAFGKVCSLIFINIKCFLFYLEWLS